MGPSIVTDSYLHVHTYPSCRWIEAPTDVNAYYFAPFNHIGMFKHCFRVLYTLMYTSFPCQYAVVLEGILHLPTFDDDWPM